MGKRKSISKKLRFEVFKRYGKRVDTQAWHLAFKKIGGICFNRQMQREGDIIAQ